MKNLLSFILVIYPLANFAYTINEDTTRFKLGTTQVIVIESEDDTLVIDGSDLGMNDGEKPSHDPDELARWAGFFVGVNGYTTSDYDPNLPAAYKDFDLDYGKSFNFNLNIAEWRIEFGTPHVGLTTGLGFEFNRYEFKRNVNFSYNSDSIYAVQDTNFNYDKNFLKATYIQLPLILDFTTSKQADKGFYLGGGIIAGYRIGSKMKIKYEADGNKNKERSVGHYNINPFKASLTARIGYRGVTLFGNYSLTQLFEKNRGPELYPFSVGVSLIPF